MPTLLDLCHIPISDSVEGISAVSNGTRDMLYGEVNEEKLAARMAHDGRYKLVYYPVGNCIQLFDLGNDPMELNNLYGVDAHKDVEEKLIGFLISNLYNGDENWVIGDKLTGLKNEAFISHSYYDLSGQRGGHWPPPIGI